VPNGFHKKFFRKTQTNYLHKHLSLPNSAKIILSVGRNHIKKGYRYGIMAVKRLRDENKFQDWHYVLVGRGVQTLVPLITEHDLADCVHLVEEIPSHDIQLCYSASDIFFSPSIIEGLSLVSIEAMACGLPLVLTDTPGNTDIVTENKCGILVKDRDFESMASGLLKLIIDPDQRKTFSEIALKTVEKYDWVNIAIKYEKVYRKVLGLG